MSYLLDHGGCQPVDHAHPDFIRLDAGCVRNTMGLHAIHSPHDPSCKGLDVELEDRLESTDHLLGRKHLAGQGRNMVFYTCFPPPGKTLSLGLLLLVSHLTVSFS